METLTVEIKKDDYVDIHGWRRVCAVSEKAICVEIKSYVGMGKTRDVSKWVPKSLLKISRIDEQKGYNKFYVFDLPEWLINKLNIF